MLIGKPWGAKMSDAWQTEADDLAIAEAVVEEYAEQAGDEDVGFFDIVMSKQQQILDIRVAPWVVKLARVFKEKYGEDQGEAIFIKVLFRRLLRDETLH